MREMTWPALLISPYGAVGIDGYDGQCSPRQKMTFKSRMEGSKCV
jgi:hypothetical protein